jgi:hypothetical protein
VGGMGGARGVAWPSRSLESRRAPCPALLWLNKEKLGASCCVRFLLIWQMLFEHLQCARVQVVDQETAQGLWSYHIQRGSSEEGC